MIEIEGILNSKPLGYVSSDIADPDPVTPNLLLMGRHDASLPLVTYPDSELHSRRQWRHSQILSDHFWAHFLRNYLPSLQSRQKWRTDNPNLQPNTVILILDPHLPDLSGQWAKSYPSIPARMASVGLLMSKSRTGHTRGPLPTLFLSQPYLILRELSNLHYKFGGGC